MRLKDFDTPAEHRWSELVPPRTALTFAAIWDEEEGMVTFSGAHLLDSETDKGNSNKFANDSPCDIAFADDQSQVLTIDRYGIAIADDSPPTYPGHPLPSAGADSLAFARDAMIDTETCMDSHSCLTPGGLRVPHALHTAPDSPAVASSMALASLANVPFRRTLMQNPFRRSRERPDLRVHTDDQVRYCDEYVDSAGSDVTDEGFFEDRRLTTGTFGSAPVLVEVNLSSAFSVTTTSTSRYVEVDHPSQAEQYSCEKTCVNSSRASSARMSAWSTLRDVDRQICFNVPLEFGRRLKKHRAPRRPSSAPATPADPAEVLARRFYNHIPSPGRASGMSDMSTWSGVGHALAHGRNTKACGGGSGGGGGASPMRMGSLKRTKSLLHRVVPCKKHEGKDERWVYVEVEHKVKQRVCEVCV
ncbi:hypothetical protein C8Q76DRAFT_632341 [Earliella scabrosa]|nr:hypothetical protein C8Q76DRAFT_632341 [Earliella scabrosa]